MKHFSATLAILFLMLTACSDSTIPEDAPSGLQQVESPAPAATILAPGAVSTAAPEFATSFSPDGETVYFNRASEDRSQVTLMESRLQSGAWSPAKPLSFSGEPFSGEPFDVDPFVSADGSRLYFSTNRPHKTGPPSFDTWWVDLEDGDWGIPFRPGAPLNTDSAEIFVSVSKEGVIYFSSDRDGTTRIYSSSPDNGDYLSAEVVPFEINLTEGAGNPLISPNGEQLLFVSEREGGLGGADLYVTNRQAGVWSSAQPLKPPANSPYADFAPALSRDGKTLIFTSERPGIVDDFPEGERRPGDIFQVELEAVLP